MRFATRRFHFSFTSEGEIAAAESHPAMAAFANSWRRETGSAADDAATHLSQPETNADDPIGASLNRS